MNVPRFLSGFQYFVCSAQSLGSYDFKPQQQKHNTNTFVQRGNKRAYQR